MSELYDRALASTPGAALTTTSSEQTSRVGAVSAVDAALAQAGGGTPMGDARIHDDPTSHAAAEALGANAFAAGQDVFFGAGKFAPGTDAGDRLIAHELTHVEQTRGVAAPTPGNFRVSSPSDAEEHAAVAGESGVTGQSHTIYRDRGPGPAPAEGGAGPAANGAANTYEEWKSAIQSSQRDAAVAKWGALDRAQQARVASEPASFLQRVVTVMQKDSPAVLQAAGARIDDHVLTIFASAEFEQFLPTLRAAGLLTPFLNANPRRGAVQVAQAQKLKTWLDVAPNVIEAREIFQKVYPPAKDTATPALAFFARPIAWTVAHLQRLYSILLAHVPIGHVQTVTGGFFLENQGFGWWEPAHKRVALPAHGGSTRASSDPTGHNMTGGTRSGADNTYTLADGTAGAQTTIGHYEGTVLHEIGHGVGDQMGGNDYAQNPASYPGWTALTPEQWANELWVAPTGTGDASVPEEAQLDERGAKKMFIHEIQHGVGTYKHDRGWFKKSPSNAQMQAWVKSRYANVPLMKWWEYLALQGNDKSESYSWDNPDARTRGTWTYAYLTRSVKPFMKLKTEAYTNKVSWYSVSSPVEWFAEQYTHYYRTEKTGGGRIDSTTKQLLDRLDTQGFDPDARTGRAGASRGGSTDPQGAMGRAQAGEVQGGGGNAIATEPLFFPW